MNSASQKVALITGASRGIDRAVAERLAQDGFAVVINYTKSADQAQQLVRVLAQQGSRATVLGIFITHSHPDHYSGLEVLTGANPTVPIYATQAAIEAMQQLDAERRGVWKPMFGEEYADYMVTPPHLVRSGQALVVDGVTFNVQELGLGETTDMTVLHLPAYNALFAADVVYNRVHPWLGEGHSHGWVKQIEFCMNTYADAEIIFGGHGDAGGTGILGEYMAYLLFAASWSKTPLRAAKSPRLSTGSSSNFGS